MISNILIEKDLIYKWLRKKDARIKKYTYYYFTDILREDIFGITFCVINKVALFGQFNYDRLYFFREYFNAFEYTQKEDELNLKLADNYITKYLLKH